ncbi:hypothetical protein BH23THE1_BH23THE1_00520 [soil metagenome]
MNELRYETSSYVNYGIVSFENLIMLNSVYQKLPLSEQVNSPPQLRHLR